jgi:F0F1-type ATP synthase membrane subunit c/vacuolar-type H+-ATPase subunit K
MTKSIVKISVLVLPAVAVVIGIAVVGVGMAYFGGKCVKHTADQPTTKNEIFKLCLICLSMLEVIVLALLGIAFMIFMRLIK